MYEVLPVIIIATLLAIVFWKLKQPPILAYLLTGMLIGSYGFNIVKDHQLISSFSQLGVAFLLFLVGLELNITKMRKVGKASVLTGAGQLIFTGLFGYVICILLGFSSTESIYIGIALTFSSTIIIVKLLSEKNEIDTLYGRIAIGFLLVQDFAAILILMLLDVLQRGGSVANIISNTMLMGVFFVASAVILSKYIMPAIFSMIAKSHELLFLSSISCCFAFLYASSMLGFSVEIGSFLAGIALASMPFYYEIAVKIRPLRDFFIVLFFVLLGTEMVFTTEFIVPIAILSLFVLIGNPLIVMGIMGFLGYGKRTSFFASLAVAQISEFSLILAAAGIAIGHINSAIGSLITSVGIITIAVSTYMITYNKQLFNLMKPVLDFLPAKKESSKIAGKMKNHMLILGCDRMGFIVADLLESMGKNVLVIDFDPDVIKRLERKNIPFIYGDASDPETLREARITKSKIVVSTIPDIEENIFLIRECKKYRVPVIVTANNLEEANELYCRGADYVILPHLLGGEKASSLLRDFLRDPSSIRRAKKHHISYLRNKMKLVCKK